MQYFWGDSSGIKNNNNKSPYFISGLYEREMDSILVSSCGQHHTLRNRNMVHLFPK